MYHGKRKLMYELFAPIAHVQYNSKCEKKNCKPMSHFDPYFDERKIAEKKTRMKKGGARV